MKKLSTILFTILFLCITINSAFANVFNLTASNTKATLVYFNQSVRSSTTYNCTGNLCSTDVSGLVSLDSYYLTFVPNSDTLTEHLYFTGVIQIQNWVGVGQGQSQEMPSISSIAVKSGDNTTDLGFCVMQSIGANHQSMGSIGQAVDSNTGITYNIFQSTTNFSLDCYMGTNRLLTNNEYNLQFYFNNGLGAITGARYNVTSQLNYHYLSYDGEYNNNLELIRQAIENISIPGGISNQDLQNQTQDIINNQDSNTQDIIDNNNNNTQQIVDQLTSESCTQVNCSNLFHPVGNVTSPSSGVMGDSYIEFNNTWGTQDMNIINNQTIFTLERGKTYYYNFVCDHDNLYNFRFGGSGNYTSYMQCGTGSFTWDGVDREINIVSVSVTYPGNPTSVHYRVDIFISENEGDFCNYGSTIEECSGSNRLDNINNSITQIGSDLSDTNTDDVDDELEDLFEQDIEDFGLGDFTDTISSYISGVANSSCSPIHLQFPYLQNKYIDLPCLTPIYQQKFGLIYDLYALVIRGIISYVCVIEIYKTIHDILDPDHNKVVMLDL